MKAVCNHITAIIVAFVLVAFPGCKKEEEPQTSPAPTEAAQTQTGNEVDDQIAAEDTSITDLVSLWDAGKKDEAKEKFLSVDWQDASILKQIRGLSMSEEALISVSNEDRDGIVEETLSLLSSMRKLFSDLASQAERLAATGDTAKAKEYLDAIRRYGISLSGPDHLQVVQMHGKAAVGYAQKKLSEL
ncbi:MAG: hypothetical protein AMJ65_14940 [Phycisphaerae bacterium SG8_4]|nr:MAG: hypothetical protein AMJ65_14940 [Phycisphaerae bacterium SG8_4]